MQFFSFLESHFPDIPGSITQLSMHIIDSGGCPLISMLALIGVCIDKQVGTEQCKAFAVMSQVKKFNI